MGTAGGAFSSSELRSSGDGERDGGAISSTCVCDSSRMPQRTPVSNGRRLLYMEQRTLLLFAGLLGQMEYRARFESIVIRCSEEIIRYGICALCEVSILMRAFIKLLHD